MSEHTIKCWSCGTSKTLNEIRTADGYCPECEVEIDLAEYYPKLAADYDALHAEAEARLEREQIALAHAMDAASEAERLRTELEAARGLLRDMRQRCQLPDWARSQIDKLTATPAPEVRPDLIRFDFINADGQQDSKMITHDDMRERYAALAEQGERQEAVAWALANSADEIGGFAPIYYTKEGAISWANGRNIFPLYTAPQPGPDVRALVNEMEHIVERGRVERARLSIEALEAQIKAQQGDSNDT